MNTAVVLLSGGMDSAVVLAHVVTLTTVQGGDPVPRYDRVVALSFDYNQRYDVELNFAVRLAQRYGVEHVLQDIDLDVVAGATSLLVLSTDSPASGDPRRTVVPGRNTIFLAHAIGYAASIESSAIYIGANADDAAVYHDCRPEFIDAMSAVAEIATPRRIRIHAPLINKTKASVVQCGRDLGVDFDLTWSCYAPTREGSACGTCAACLARKHAFAADHVRRERGA